MMEKRKRGRSIYEVLKENNVKHFRFTQQNDNRGDNVRQSLPPD